MYDTVWLVKMGLENQVNEFIMLFGKDTYINASRVILI